MQATDTANVSSSLSLFSTTPSYSCIRRRRPIYSYSPVICAFVSAILHFYVLYSLPQRRLYQNPSARYLLHFRQSLQPHDPSLWPWPTRRSELSRNSTSLTMISTDTSKSSSDRWVGQRNPIALFAKFPRSLADHDQIDEGLKKDGATLSQIPTYVTGVPNGTEKVSLRLLNYVIFRDSFN